MDSNHFRERWARAAGEPLPATTATTRWAPRAPAAVLESTCRLCLGAGQLPDPFGADVPIPCPQCTHRPSEETAVEELLAELRRKGHIGLAVVGLPGRYVAWAVDKHGTVTGPSAGGPTPEEAVNALAALVLPPPDRTVTEDDGEA